MELKNEEISNLKELYRESEALKVNYKEKVKITRLKR